MKKLLLAIFALGVLVLGLFAQESSDRGTATLTLGEGKVAVEFGRPLLKGRDPESMISPGEEWRMGSNASTTLDTDMSLKFGNKVVSQGKYILKAKFIAKEKWHLLIQKEDKSNIAEIPLIYQKTDNAVEQMNIKLEKQGNGGKFTLEWGKFIISTDFQKA